MNSYAEKLAPEMPEPDWEQEARQHVNAAIDCLDKGLVSDNDLMRLQIALHAAKTARSAKWLGRLLARPF